MQRQLSRDLFRRRSKGKGRDNESMHRLKELEFVTYQIILERDIINRTPANDMQRNQHSNQQKNGVMVYEGFMNHAKSAGR
jgi:polysaccharide pyruvyl transferase WcaK-like protein